MIGTATETGKGFSFLGRKVFSPRSLKSSLSVCRNARIGGRPLSVSVARTGESALPVRVFVHSGRGKVPMSRWIIVEPLQLESDNSPHEKDFPSAPGCYVVYCDDRVAYVGQTTNLLKRLRSYKLNYAHYSTAIETPWGRCQKLVVKYRIPKRFGEQAMTELRLIKRLQPPGNCVGSIRKRGAE